MTTKSKTTGGSGKGAAKAKDGAKQGTKVTAAPAPVEQEQGAKTTVVVAAKAKPSKKDLNAAIRSIAEAHVELKDGESRILQDDKLGSVEVSRAGEEHLLIALMDNGFRTFIWNLTTMKVESDSEATPVLERNGLGATKEPKAPKAPKKKKEKPEPVWVTQKAYDGTEEQLDKNLYKNEVVCAECGEIRYVKDADRHQVSLCKPCKRKKDKGKKRDRVKASKKRKVAEARGAALVIADAMITDTILDLIEENANHDGDTDKQIRNNKAAICRALAQRLTEQARILEAKEEEQE